MKRFLTALLLLALTGAVLTGCGGQQTGKNSASADDTLVIYSPHPIAFTTPLVQEFEKQSGIKVEVISAGAGELLKRVESEKASPLGDILWGGSINTIKPKAALFEPYSSVNEVVGVVSSLLCERLLVSVRERGACGGRTS